MRVLIACETSGVVRQAFRQRGHYAVSCDILPAEDNSPYHIQGDALPVIAQGAWDLVVAHPPCTHLAVSGARWFPAKRRDGRQREGVVFFLACIAACNHIGAAWALENPIGIMSTVYRKPDQIIQPWMFGHGETKATCLWLHGIPRLIPTQIVEGRLPRVHRLPPTPDRWRLRSRTYQGVAEAMAVQWGRR